MQNIFSNSRELVEDSFRLRVRDLKKRVLVPEKPSFEALMAGNMESPNGWRGNITLSNGASSLVVDCEIDLGQQPAVLNLHYAAGRAGEFRDQSIELETRQISFGARWYFKCLECGILCNSLFLAPGGTSFLCRKSANLVYGLSRINKRSYLGGLLYLLNRRQNLEDMQKIMVRPFYRGKITRRAERFLRAYQKMQDATNKQYASRKSQELGAAIVDILSHPKSA